MGKEEDTQRDSIYTYISMATGWASGAPSAELAHARTVLLVTLEHEGTRLSLLLHSAMDASVPSQSTAAIATGKCLNSTYTAKLSSWPS